jgi:hypothetical protein
LKHRFQLLQAEACIKSRFSRLSPYSQHAEYFLQEAAPPCSKTSNVQRRLLPSNYNSTAVFQLQQYPHRAIEVASGCNYTAAIAHTGIPLAKRLLLKMSKETRKAMETQPQWFSRYEGVAIMC